MTKDSKITIIKSLSAELLEDFLYFFDNALYTDNPDWTKCYCYSFHYTGGTGFQIEKELDDYFIVRKQLKK